MDDLKVLDLAGAGSKAIPNGLRDVKGGQRPWQAWYDEKYYAQEAAPPPPRQAAPSGGRPQVPGKVIQPSPTPSYQSTSSYSMPQQEVKEEKKKRGLFGF